MPFPLITRLINLLVKGYTLLIKAGDLLQPLVLLAFRLAWGIEFFISGQGKLKNHKDIVDFFTSLHIPFPDLNAWFVGGLELVGGVLLILGFLSRPIALMLAVNMTVAFLAVDDDRALVFNMLHSTKDFDAFTQADPYFYWLTAVMVLAFGSGAISLDNLLGKTIFKSKAKITVPIAPPVAAPNEAASAASTAGSGGVIAASAPAGAAPNDKTAGGTADVSTESESQTTSQASTEPEDKAST
jgi:putative oxidoreductase